MRGVRRSFFDTGGRQRCFASAYSLDRSIGIAGILRRVFADWFRSSIAAVQGMDRQRLFAHSHLIVASLKARVAQQGCLAMNRSWRIYQ